MDLPTTHDLIHIDVEVVIHDEPWVVSLTAIGDDGSAVRLTWDELANSATFWWHQEDALVLRMTREAVSRVMVRQHKGTIELQVHTKSDELSGVLVFSVGKSVTVNDTLLRS